LRFRLKRLVVAALLLTVPLLTYADIVTISLASDQWIEWARIAWTYFQPGICVNPNTGLDYAAAGWHRFTDWDLSAYVEAIMDAEKLGILSRDGDWGSNYRIEKVLSFLENRPLTGDMVPYKVYDADTGRVATENGDTIAHPSDSAKLLLSLDDLRHFRPEYAQRINILVARHNFQKLANSDYFSANDIYPAYVAQGYAAFGYSTPKLRPVGSLGDGQMVAVYNETLPKSWVTSEPLMLAILEDRSTGLYRTYADRVFRAQSERFQATKKMTAFSEGTYWYPISFVYEWIVTGEGKTWVVYDSGGREVNAVPIVYVRVALAFHAIYNNQYTSALVNWLSPSSLQATSPLGGFYEGKSEEGARLSDLTDKTNEMILAAALYYVTHTTTTSASTETSTTSTTSASTETSTTSTTSASTETSTTSMTSASTSATTTATSSGSTETASTQASTTSTTGATVTQTSTGISTSTVSTVLTSVTTTPIVGLQIQVVSNSSVSSLIFDSTRGLLNFTVSGPTGSYGFFNATIAKSLISGQPIVMMDGVQTTAAVSDDANFWYIHVTYTHSEHHVTIGGSNTVPEFPPASLLAIVLMLTIVIFRRRHKN
jgi:hypothetical protein